MHIQAEGDPLTQVLFRLCVRLRTNPNTKAAEASRRDHAHQTLLPFNVANPWKDGRWDLSERAAEKPPPWFDATPMIGEL